MKICAFGTCDRLSAGQVGLRARPTFLMVVVFLLSTAAALNGATEPAFSEPSFSPDGREIAFVSGGDIWTVPATGGEARLLIANPSNETRPLYSPDGTQLAFNSNRTGNGDIYVLDLSSGDVRRLTFDDGNEELDAWSPDGKWIYFHSTGRDVAGMNDIYRIPSAGGTAMAISADRYVNEYFAAPAPDRKAIAFAARGISSGQWWRHGRSHIDESQIYLLRDPASHVYEELTSDGAKEIWPMWSPDGKSLWFMSDRDGNENIWTMPLGGQARRVTSFTSGRVLWPSISRDGRTIVFERDFAIWKLDTSTGKATALEIHRRGSPAAAAVEDRKLSARF